MTDASNSPSLVDQVTDSQAPRHTGIGITQWLAFGLLLFTLLAVILAVVFNLIFGSPGG
jgi:hypothetical protein